MSDHNDTGTDAGTTEDAQPAIDLPTPPKPGEGTIVTVTAEVDQDAVEYAARALAFAEAEDRTVAKAREFLLEAVRIDDRFKTPDGRDAAKVALSRADAYAAGTAPNGDGDSDSDTGEPNDG